MNATLCNLNIATEHDMLALGAQLASACGSGGCVVYLKGELGTGKTTLVRGFLQALNPDLKVKSPTFTLVEPYQFPGRSVFHFDLYRLGDPEELEYIGIRDYSAHNPILLVEWPEKGTGALPQADLEVDIQYAGMARTVRIVASTANGAAILQRLSDALKQH